MPPADPPDYIPTDISDGQQGAIDEYWGTRCRYCSHPRYTHPRRTRDHCTASIGLDQYRALPPPVDVDPQQWRPAETITEAQRAHGTCPCPCRRFAEPPRRREPYRRGPMNH
jgi:hypothetical protein